MYTTKKVYEIVMGFILCVIAVIATMVIMPQHVSAQGTSGNQHVNAAFNSKPATLRLTLNKLLHEHTVLAATMLQALYNGEDTSELEQLMSDNQDQLATQIQNVYGKSAADKFNQLWSDHMDEYKNYTQAKKDNDTDAMNTARTNLQNIATNMGNLLVTNTMSATAVKNLMMDHVNGTLTFVDAVAEDDSAAQAQAMKKGFDQAGSFADSLTRGLISGKPQMFQ